jgi:hypothetical protein
LPKLGPEQSILPNLIPAHVSVGYWGGVVLRCLLDNNMTGLICLLPRPAKAEDAKSVSVPLATDLDPLGAHRDQEGNVVIAEQGVRA